MNTPTFRMLLWLVVATLLLPFSAFSQKAPAGTATPPPSGGPLTPPGPPGRTMKSLDQVEPRTDLQVLYDLNHDGDEDDTNYEIVINGSGSYYLSKNLNVTRPNGIVVRAPNVTIDLNGFSVQRFLVSGNGIEIGPGAFGVLNGCVIKNGAISGFNYGVRTVASGANYPNGGVFSKLTVSGCTIAALEAGQGWLVEGCRVHDSPGHGIYAQDRSIIRDCIVTKSGGGNAANEAIHAGTGSSISHCVASGNQVTAGIRAGNGSTIVDCTAYQNVSSASVSAGIYAQFKCQVQRCVANENTSSASPATSETGIGITAGAGSLVEDCAANDNRGDGISVGNDSTVRNNNCDGNGIGTGNGAGVHALAQRVRIENNNVTDNDRGIEVDTAGCLIIRNSAGGNGNNYDIAANNVFGAVVDRRTPASGAVVGNGPVTSSLATTDPWANISY